MIRIVRAPYKQCQGGDSMEANICYLIGGVAFIALVIRLSVKLNKKQEDDILNKL